MLSAGFLRYQVIVEALDSARSLPLKSGASAVPRQSPKQQAPQQATDAERHKAALAALQHVPKFLSYYEEQLRKVQAERDVGRRKRASSGSPGGGLVVPPAGELVTKLRASASVTTSGGEDAVGGAMVHSSTAASAEEAEAVVAAVAAAVAERDAAVAAALAGEQRASSGKAAAHTAMPGSPISKALENRAVRDLVGSYLDVVDQAGLNLAAGPSAVESCGEPSAAAEVQDKVEEAGSNGGTSKRSAQHMAGRENPRENNPSATGSRASSRPLSARSGGSRSGVRPQSARGYYSRHTFASGSQAQQQSADLRKVGPNLERYVYRGTAVKRPVYHRENTVYQSAEAAARSGLLMGGASGGRRPGDVDRDSGTVITREMAAQERETRDRELAARGLGLARSTASSSGRARARSANAGGSKGSRGAVGGVGVGTTPLR